MHKPTHTKVLMAMLGTFPAAIALSGCDDLRTAMSFDGSSAGLVVVLPGIDGCTPHSQGIRDAIATQRPDLTVVMLDWTSPLGPLFNQTAADRNRGVARQVANQITAYRQAHPGRAVFLVGHSGGTAIAVWAAEALPEGHAVDGIVLLASSLSPEYDLSAALRRSAGGIVSFYSDRDSVLLGTGTTLVGTMDGRHCPAAGMVGFRQGGPGCGGLRQIAWSPEMATRGNDGGHFSYAADAFVSEYLVPLIGARPAAPALAAALP